MAENIIQTEYSAEMHQSFINYSMSVITARAVPDVRDGLKPVQRRVLFAMNELGLNADKPHRKSARIVGDAMGKYHPHGDSSIYESLVVLSQDFKKGMALVDGHGNFGSIEGDGAAAMRYTEARLKKFTQEVYLADLDKDVVDFVPNFDETEKEPSVLPVRIPNVLVNGSEGIAVGMTTSIPTHNLAEVIEAMKYLMDHPQAETAQLMKYMPGPDFPTGGIVTNQSELLSIYETGKGKIKVRGKAEIVRGTKKSEKDNIVITEIPYTMIGVNIGKFLSDVAALVETRKLPDITDISNQSSKEGIKIVIELKKGCDAEKILQGLYKKTKLEDTFGVNMLVIDGNKPKVMGLKNILESNIAFQIELNTRKYKTLLKKEQDKKEIQEGLMQAVDIIDLIIEIIRGSKDIKMARGCLTQGNIENIKFKTKASQKQASTLHFTEMQATAILELRLSKLIGLEILALQKEHDDTLAKIALYEKILGDKKTMMNTIKADLDRIKKSYSLPRKTRLANEEAAVYEEAPIEEVPVVFVMNRFGYVKTMDPAVYEKNKEVVMAENKIIFTCKNTSRLGVFTREGNMHQVKVLDLPLAKLKDKGVPIDNVCNYDSAKENLVSIWPIDLNQSYPFIFVTEAGYIKKVPADEMLKAKKTIASTKLKAGDGVAAIIIGEQSQILLITNVRTCLRYATTEIPLATKGAIGVKGIRLADGQKVTQVYGVEQKQDLRLLYGEEEVDFSKIRCKKRDARPDKF